MTTMLNDRAASVVFALTGQLARAGFATEVLDGVRAIGSVGSPEDLGKAADLCQQLAVMFDGSDHAVSQAATRAYFVLADQSGRKDQRCTPCSFQLHPTNLHSSAAEIGGDEGLESHPLCHCYCQAKG